MKNYFGYFFWAIISVVLTIITLILLGKFFGTKVQGIGVLIVFIRGTRNISETYLRDIINEKEDKR